MKVRGNEFFIKRYDRHKVYAYHKVLFGQSINGYHYVTIVNSNGEVEKLDL